MKFHDYHTLYSVYKQAGLFDANHFAWDVWYQMMRADAARLGDRVSMSQLGLEFNWCLAKQPYYNVWPAIIPPLLKLNLALSTSYLKPPKEELLIRLPEERNPLHFDWNGTAYEIHTILLVRLHIRDRNCPGVGMWIDYGERLGQQPILTYQNMVCDGAHSLEEEITSLPQHWGASYGVQMPLDTLKDCLRLCCTLCLLENDPTVVTADVLNNDKVKFEKTGDSKYIDKAHRRGKVGWNIGMQMTVSPHIRIPHSCLFWTGEGRRVPVIKIRAGTVVHRSKIEKIPTGHFMVDGGTPDE